MTAYYNDNDPYVAQWLRNLIVAGFLPPGDVDERDIHDIHPDDLRGYTQVHLFAGIGGWPLALSLASWPASAPVWTGSCPCQPYSAAGRRQGDSDPRNLWPEFRRLLAVCRPPVVFGEQVASNDGRTWLAGVRADLEDLGYGVGAADLCAASVGAPHIRQRLYWVAHSNGLDGERGSGERRALRRAEGGETADYNTSGRGAIDGRLADSQRDTRESRGATDESREGPREACPGPYAEPGRCGSAGGMADADGSEWRAQAERGLNVVQWPDARRQETASGFGLHRSPWADATLVLCRDGKARRLEPGLSPLAHGVPARVGKLCAYGNSIVPQVAARFIEAYMSA